MCAEKHRPRIALLTGAKDRPYALGMTEALLSAGYAVDFIGGNALDAPALHSSPYIRFLNYRGNQDPALSPLTKAKLMVIYYLKLIRYAFLSPCRVFHLLWNNKFQTFDRVILMLYYRCLGKRIVFTAHNVNAGKRDGCDSKLNQLTLRIQYSLCEHILVHTAKMKVEIEKDFCIAPEKVSVIPFGINNTAVRTGLTRKQAKERLGLENAQKILLFFGHIAPYKGLEFLVEALRLLVIEGHDIKLIIAGAIKPGSEEYWRKVEHSLGDKNLRNRVVQHVRYISDSEVETFMTAADAVALPYVYIFQSGVPFLAYSFGLPVIATDVGSLREDVLEGKTGFIAAPNDPMALACAITTFYSSHLYKFSEKTHEFIARHANESNSWSVVGEMVSKIYRSVDAELDVKEPDNLASQLDASNVSDSMRRS